MIIAGLWRYGDWHHVATGCNALVMYHKRLAGTLTDRVRELSLQQHLH